MEVRGYCDNCDIDFNYDVNNMNDLKRVVCPRCNRVVTGKRRPICVSNNEEVIGRVAYFFINFYFYFYFIFSSICLISFYMRLNKLFLFSFVVMCFLYLLELFLGYTRNLFGVFGVIVGGVIGYLFLDSIFIGIVYVFFISSVIKAVFNFILNVILWRCR